MVTETNVETGISLQLTSEHEELRRAVRDFARKEILPVAAHFDETGEFPYDVIKKMGKMGLMGIEVPEEYGGAGSDTISHVLTVGEGGKGAAAHSTVVKGNKSLGSHRRPECATGGE